MKLLSGKCYRTSLMITQHWFRLWLVAIRQQAITWANVDPDLCRHLASLSLNELTSPRFKKYQQAKYLVIAVTSHEHCDISDHWQINCLLSKLFRLTTKKTPKLHYLSGESTCDRRIPLTKVPVTGGSPSQRVSHAGSISWSVFQLSLTCGDMSVIVFIPISYIQQ